MNAYRVHYTHFEHAQVFASAMHVAARTREEAVYKAFDELADQEVVLEAFWDVFIQVDDQWVKTYSHTRELASS